MTALNIGINFIGPTFACDWISYNILITNIFWSKYEYTVSLAINKLNKCITFRVCERKWYNRFTIEICYCAPLLHRNLQKSGLTQILWTASHTVRVHVIIASLYLRALRIIKCLGSRCRNANIYRKSRRERKNNQLKNKIKTLNTVRYRFFL